MDRRIRKTKQAIVTAFLELLDEKKDIDKISITDITKRADISRSTFYFHYNGTYELVDEICDSFTKQIYSIILKAHSDMPGENGYLYMYNEILSYLYENKTTTRLLMMSPKEADMTKKICDDSPPMASCPSSATGSTPTSSTRRRKWPRSPSRPSKPPSVSSPNVNNTKK